jgi:hypothetical protein
MPRWSFACRHGLMSSKVLIVPENDPLSAGQSFSVLVYVAQKKYSSSIKKPDTFRDDQMISGRVWGFIENESHFWK